MTIRIILFLVLLLNTLHAEFYYSGKINIPYNFNLNTYKNTELPIRFIDLNLSYSLICVGPIWACTCLFNTKSIDSF